MEISCLTQVSDYDNFWNSLSYNKKYMYLNGMRDGVARASIK